MSMNPWHVWVFVVAFGFGVLIATIVKDVA